MAMRRWAAACVLGASAVLATFTLVGWRPTAPPPPAPRPHAADAERPVPVSSVADAVARFASPAGSPRAGPGGPAIVGLLVPDDEAVGAAMRRGAERAAADSGGAVVLAVRRARGPWGGAADAATALVAEEGAIALVGGLERTTAHLLAQVATKTHTPALVLADSPSVASTGSAWVFHTSAASPAIAAERAVRLVVGALGRAGGPDPSALREALAGGDNLTGAPCAGIPADCSGHGPGSPDGPEGPGGKPSPEQR